MSLRLRPFAKERRKEDTGRLSDTPRRRLRIPLMLLIGVGTALSAGGYYFANRINHEAEQNRFEKEANLVFNQVEVRVVSTVAILHSIAGLFVASETVTREEFRAFVESLGEMPAVQALEWIPRVPREDRPIYEDSANRDGHAGFHFTERRPDGTIVVAADRHEYFPVYFVHPYAGNEAALGFDIASNVTRLEALQQARDSGDLVATARITLVQETGQQYGFLVFVPVYSDEIRPTAIAARRDDLAGFGLGVFRMGDLVEDAISSASTSTPSVEIQILDNLAPIDVRRLYPQRMTPADRSAPIDSRFRTSRDITVGGRHWTMVATLPADFGPAWLFRWQSWAVFCTGLTLTFLTGLYVNQSLTRADVVGRLVEQRTAQLRESEARSHAVIDNAVDAIVTIDARGVVETFNPAAERVFGYSAEDCIGRNVSMLMPDPDKSRHDGYIADFLSTGEAKIIGFGREVVGRRKDGETFPMDLSVSEFHPGKGTMFVGLCRDVTARRRDQEAMTTASKELESFAYSVSHDLRAPLRAMDGFSQALVEDYGDKLGGDAKNYLERIRGGARRMGKLIDDLLGLSRVSRREMNRETVDLSKLAGGVVQELRETNPNREIFFDISSNLSVQGDERLLRILLENLIGNAWKFTTKTEEARVELGAILENGELVNYVRDNGAGFDMAYADKLFAPFQRLHSTAEFEGTGIGLATVARIVQRHGGRIWAEGKLRKGATVYYTLSR